MSPSPASGYGQCYLPVATVFFLAPLRDLNALAGDVCAARQASARCLLLDGPVVTHHLFHMNVNPAPRTLCALE